MKLRILLQKKFCHPPELIFFELVILPFDIGTNTRIHGLDAIFTTDLIKHRKIYEDL